MKKQKVLVIDDEETIRHALTRMLSREGLDVVAAADGEEGNRLFEEHNPDLVLLDIMMPKKSGFEVCRELKSDPIKKLTPILVLTSSNSPENRQKMLELGADDFLSKPLCRVELSARVRSLLKTKHYIDDLESAEAVLFALAQSIEGKDPNTQGHCERLSIYGEKLGRLLEMEEQDVQALRIAGIVHDIGKVAVPDAVLLKPTRLTDEEMDVIKQHPVIGEKICRSLKSFRRVLPIIRHHHERRDGTGYPDGLKGEEIPKTARVLQIIDIYDALTTARPYKPAWSDRKSLDMMQEEVEKGWWDPEIFSVFRKLVEAGGLRHESAPASEEEAEPVTVGQG